MSNNLENAALDAKTNLKKHIKEGKTNCASLATTIERIIDNALWEYMPNLPGETAADKMHNLIVLPYDKGGLNTAIHEVDALLSISSRAQRKFRLLVHEAKPGERNDLKGKKENKVNTEISPTKSKGKPNKRKSKNGQPSSSQMARERAADRAAKAIPKLDELMEEGLVAKNVAAKAGQQVKNPQKPTSEEKKVIANQEAIKAKLEKIVPKQLPENPQERKKLAAKIKQAIEEQTGLKSKAKLTLNPDPQAMAKTLAETVKDVEYLQQLLVALEFEIEDLMGKSKTVPIASAKSNKNAKAA